MKISVVIPVHNEAKYLPYTLPALRMCRHDFHEFIFVLDRCTDRSEDLIFEYLPDALIYRCLIHEYRYFTVENINKAFKIASGDVVLLLGADCLIPVDLPDIIEMAYIDNPDLGILSLHYKNIDLFSLRRRLHGIFIQSLSLKRYKHDSGLFAVHRCVFDRVGYLDDTITEYLDYYRRIRRSGLDVEHRKTNILHLRVGVGSRKQYIQGVAMYHLPMYKRISVYLHALIHLKPYVIVGYQHAKRYGIEEVGSLQ